MRTSSHAYLLMALVGWSVPCLAQPVQVKDINDLRATNASDFVSLGKQVFFVADDAVVGRELWKVPLGGSTASLVRDIWPGGGSGAPSGLTVQNGSLYFAADDGVHGSELWKSDGTAAGTMMVRDIAPGLTGSQPASLVDVHASLLYFWRWSGSLFFTANDGEHGRELWRSDGTGEGTVMVKDIGPGSRDASLEALVNLNGVLLASTPFQLWRSDGTEDGTTPLGPNKSGNPAESNFWAQQMTVVGKNVYFVASSGASGSGLWTSDGTSGGTRLVVAMAPGSAFANPLGLTAGKSRVFFTASGEGKRGLFMSDGSASGTTRLTPPNVEVRSSEIVVAGATVFFAASDETRGAELWRVGTDGSEARIAADLQKGPSSSSPHHLTAVGNVVLFAARTDAVGAELWRSDGTAVGTALVADLEKGPAPCSPDGLSEAGLRLFFSCQAPRGAEGATFNRPSLTTPWTTDGSPAGTVAVAGPSGRTGDSRPLIGLRTSNGFYFSAFSPDGRAIWWSDGTPGRATRILPLPRLRPSPITFAQVGKDVFFVTSRNDAGDLDWYRSDGTPAGTVQVLQDRTFREVWDIVTVGGRMIFWAYTRETGTELWVSDGTSAGTVVLKDLTPGPESSKRSALVLVNSLVYFGAAVENRGTTLWRTDGTPTGTRAVTKAGTRTDTFVAGRVAPAGEAVIHVNQERASYEVRRTSVRSSELVRRAEGSWDRPEHLTVHQGAVYFDDGGHLWRIRDGSREAELVGSLGRGAHVMAMASAASQLFLLIDGEGGRAVWASEGSMPTPRMVSRVQLDHGFVPANFVAFGDAVYFPAFEASSGIELWKSDGTSKGTGRAADLAPGPVSSDPMGLFAFGGSLYFSADDGRTGRELWRIDEPGRAGATQSARPQGN